MLAWAWVTALTRLPMPTPPQLTAVIRLLSPALKATGWTRFGGRFDRESETGLVHAINFQSSRYGGKFTTNLGVYVREIDFDFDDWWGRQGKSGEPGRDGRCPRGSLLVADTTGSSGIN